MNITNDIKLLSVVFESMKRGNSSMFNEKSFKKDPFYWMYLNTIYLIIKDLQKYKKGIDKMFIKIREIEKIIIRDLEGLKYKDSVDHINLAIARSYFENGFQSLRKSLENPMANIKQNKEN